MNWKEILSAAAQYVLPETVLGPAVAVDRGAPKGAICVGSTPMFVVRD